MANGEVIQLPSVAHRFDSEFIKTADDFLDALPEFSKNMNMVVDKMNIINPHIDNVNKVADDINNIDTVVNHITNIDNVGSNIDQVLLNSSNMPDINTVADYIKNGTGTTHGGQYLGKTLIKPVEYLSNTIKGNIVLGENLSAMAIDHLVIDADSSFTIESGSVFKII